MHSSFVLVVHRELKLEECETVAAVSIGKRIILLQ